MTSIVNNNNNNNLASFNVVEENVPEVGGWSGKCTCPDGKEYMVGDYNNACNSIACINGKSGECIPGNLSGAHRRVTCAPLTPNQNTLEAFINTVKLSIDDGNAHIKPAIQNIVLRFGEINQIYGITEGEIISANFSNRQESTQSKYWVPLIWNALKLLDYDVPDNLIAHGNLNESEKNKLQIWSKKLSQIPNWGKYALEVLNKAHNENYKDGDNSFDSKNVKNLSEKYKESSVNRNFDNLKKVNFKKKYLKYKTKYLLLKDQTL